MLLKTLRHLTSIAIILALMVVMLGAYTRLTNAGLGCPDWPGCYGHLVLPTASNQLQNIAEHYPQTSIEPQKAWTEMIHRYAAGTLALLIVVIAGMTWYGRKQAMALSSRLPNALIALVVFQAALGMWTVTLKLLPVVVMSHLLGGMLIFSCLCYFRMQLSTRHAAYLPGWRVALSVAVILVFCQIALGGWVSSNYAGVACIGFPQCNGLWWPKLHLSAGFHLFSPVGANYQGGLLDNEARVTIQWVHRLGAVLVASYVLILSILMLIKVKHNLLRCMSMLVVGLLLVQFTLGIANVVYLLPLWVAVMHNGVAALLLVALLATRYLTTGVAAHVASN